MDVVFLRLSSIIHYYIQFPCCKLATISESVAVALGNEFERDLKGCNSAQFYTKGERARWQR